MRLKLTIFITLLLMSISLTDCSKVVSKKPKITPEQQAELEAVAEEARKGYNELKEVKQQNAALEAQVNKKSKILDKQKNEKYRLMKKFGMNPTEKDTSMYTEELKSLIASNSANTMQGTAQADSTAVQTNSNDSLNTQNTQPVNTQPK